MNELHALEFNSLKTEVELNTTVRLNISVRLKSVLTYGKDK